MKGSLMDLASSTSSFDVKTLIIIGGFVLSLILVSSLVCKTTTKKVKAQVVPDHASSKSYKSQL
jgi:hypothetical protein